MVFVHNIVFYLQRAFFNPMCASSCMNMNNVSSLLTFLFHFCALRVCLQLLCLMMVLNK